MRSLEAIIAINAPNAPKRPPPTMVWVPPKPAPALAPAEPVKQFDFTGGFAWRTRETPDSR